MKFYIALLAFVGITSVYCLEDGLQTLAGDIMDKIPSDKSDVLMSVLSLLNAENPKSPTDEEIAEALSAYARFQVSFDKTKTLRKDVVFFQIDNICRKVLANFGDRLEKLHQKFALNAAGEIENDPFFKSWDSYYVICKSLTHTDS